ncbi:MAG: hypothetical protein O2958_03220 [Gemmatimonadetes bacterium]|nr:hypothetical protein [Gemmatimonadota bacterium]
MGGRHRDVHGQLAAHICANDADRLRIRQRSEHRLNRWQGGQGHVLRRAPHPREGEGEFEEVAGGAVEEVRKIEIHLDRQRGGLTTREEFAAWRYGDQFGRRRKKAILYGAGAAAVVGGVVIGGVVTGAIGGAVLGQGGNLWNLWLNGVTRVRLRTDDGRVLKLKHMDLLGTRLRTTPDGSGYSLEVRKGKKKEWFEGAEAERLIGVIMPGVNRQGGKKQTVQDAVSEIEQRGHPDEFLSDVIKGDRFRDKKGVPGYVNKMPAPTKLALEMALHEEQERRSLEGELWRLERAWEEAEEIAAISDSLLLPSGADDFIEEHRPTSDA